jgi:hypothetical protein
MEAENDGFGGLFSAAFPPTPKLAPRRTNPLGLSCNMWDREDFPKTQIQKSESL